MYIVRHSNLKFWGSHDKQFGPKFGREKYKTYFAMPENGTDEHRGNYYRSD